MAINRWAEAVDGPWTKQQETPPGKGMGRGMAAILGRDGVADIEN